MPVKLTRQGVRDLGFGKKRRRAVPVQCEHRRLRSYCHTNGRGCGHILCPDYDLYIDVGAELNGKWRW